MWFHRKPMLSGSSKSKRNGGQSWTKDSISTSWLRAPPPAGMTPVLLVSTDETGNVGPALKGESNFIMGGCIVNDVHRFEKATYDRYEGKELKFHTHFKLRNEILIEAEPFVDRVHYVVFNKRVHGWNGKGDKEKLHLDMLEALAKSIAKDYPYHLVDVVIDSTNITGVSSMVRVVMEAFLAEGIVANVAVAESYMDFALQTNDFFVGAIGYWLNTPRKKTKEDDDSKHPRNEEYIDHFRPKMKRAYYRGDS